MDGEKMAWLTNLLSTLLFWLESFSGNLGLAIIGLTLIVRLSLLPLTIPALKSQQQMKSLQPKLKELQKKYGKDKEKMQQAQVALYQEHKVNPLAGCLPFIAQFIVLIALYKVLTSFITGHAGNAIFLGLDLTQKDTSYITAILAGLSQFILSLMLAPGAERIDVIPEKSKSKAIKKLNQEESNQEDMAVMMQKQMMFVLPVMTGVFAISFPAGLAVYWIATTLFSIVQQFILTGLGGLQRYLPKGIRDKVAFAGVLNPIKEEK